MNWFLGGRRDVLDGLLDPEDRPCFQQVHDGQVEACMAAVAGLGFVVGVVIFQGPVNILGPCA